MVNVGRLGTFMLQWSINSKIPWLIPSSSRLQKSGTMAWEGWVWQGKVTVDVKNSKLLKFYLIVRNDWKIRLYAQSKNWDISTNERFILAVPCTVEKWLATSKNIKTEILIFLSNEIVREATPYGFTLRLISDCVRFDCLFIT
jgi:hypothetical protein